MSSLFIAVEPETGQWTDSIEDAHVTVVYVPDECELSETQYATITAIVEEWVGERSLPFTLTETGTGVLGKDSAAVSYMFPHERLTTLHGRCWATLRSWGIESTYPAFLPHLTWGYGIPEPEHDPNRTVQFDRVTLKCGVRHTILG